MWFDESVVYQIYPLGLCGAPGNMTGTLPTGFFGFWTGSPISSPLVQTPYS